MFLKTRHLCTAHESKHLEDGGPSPNLCAGDGSRGVVGFTWTAPQKAWLLIWQGSDKLVNYEDLTSFKD